MRMKMENKILWLMSCLLFCGQVVWGEKLTLQEAIQLAQASSPEGRSCPAYLPGSLLELPFVSGRLPT